MYRGLLKDENLWKEIDEKFRGLYAEIDSITEETDLAQLLARIPQAQFVN